MAGTQPPLFTISDNDHGGYVAVAVYTFLSLMLVTVAARLVSRWYIARVTQVDDILLGTAALLGVVQSIFVQLAINNGLGMTRSLVSTQNFQVFEKYQWAAQITLIVTTTCSKASLALLMKNMMTEGMVTFASWALMGMIAGWSILSVFGLAFQCSLPHPWDFTGRCINQDALYTAIAVLNIVTDLGLIILPCISLMKVQVSFTKRFRIMSLLAIRVSVCVAAGFQIYYTPPFLNSSNPTWDAMSLTVWNQVMMNLSIMSTAIPSLGRLAIELQPDVNAFAITDQHGLRNGEKYALSSLRSRHPRNFPMENRLGNHTSVQGSERHRSYNEDSESERGLVGDAMRQNTIQQTVDFEIH